MNKLKLYSEKDRTGPFLDQHIYKFKNPLVFGKGIATIVERIIALFVEKNFIFSCLGGMMTMRNTEEFLRFQKLIKTLLWLKKTSGKSSPEVVNAIFAQL